MATTVLIHEFVTGGGLAGEPLPPSWAAEGRAMRLALAEDFAAIDGVLVTATLDARLADEPGRWSSARIGPGREPGRFGELAAEHDYTLCVAPETGGLLEARARSILFAGGRTLGASPEAVSLCADKVRTADFLRSRGVDTPASLRVCPRDGLPRDFPYPAVLKPIDGAGSLDTFLVRSPADRPAEAMAMGEAVLQPFMPGSPMSAAILIGPGHAPALLGVADQHVRPSRGRFTYQGGAVPSRVGTPEELRPALDAVGAIPGLLGWVGVDFLREESSGAITVLEINPRVTTSYVGFRRLASPEGRASPWIARLWMEGFGHGPPRHRPAPIAEAPEVVFLADGTVFPRMPRP